MEIRCDECGRRWRSRARWWLYLRYWLHTVSELGRAVTHG
jgi:hypothetical protein